ncbi:UrcA family protein [Novosphingobium sp. G106]|uniref:UrcA family protein n=1 Tax=Novosphingobium sp. G106 TaxID=2849500 RepID=UPI001C2D6B70|nr:UrcA family protein [Novosphingobium sp. G106]MBV1689196.1 UrcA family protein [Novosphingobium sp. G106]
MSAMLLIAGALLSQTALPAASAGQDTLADNHSITATARVHRNGWLTTSAADGQYMASINVADLDLTSAAGQSAMNSRVRKATAALCEMSGDQPQMRGFYNPGARECWRKTEDQAATQMTNARAAASQGKAVATLGFATPQ